MERTTAPWRPRSSTRWLAQQQAECLADGRAGDTVAGGDLLLVQPASRLQTTPAAIAASKTRAQPLAG